MVKIAIPVSENYLNKSFGNCSHYEIFEIENNTIISKEKGIPPANGLTELHNWLDHSGITDVIVHDIDKTSIQYLADTKINLFVGIEINTPEEIIDEYLRGSLKSDAQNITKKEKITFE
jgi:predicted Fe-Mo cluster-binding NifX family protein